jgi:DNA-binding transcriptional MerR regulator/predicted RNase H-like HicB family nuclease
MGGYGSRFIEETFGIPLARLHYWDKTNLVKPSIRPAAGRGSKRLYSFPDLIQVLVIQRLRGMGISLQNVRKCLQFLRQRSPEIESPLAELALVTDGETVFLLTHEPDALLDTLREQAVWSVPIARLVRSAREAIGRATARRQEKVSVGGREFTVMMEQDPEDGWWVGFVEELPGCGSQGATLDELREMIMDAAREYLIVRGDITRDGQEEAADSVAV